jgi:multicomponent Na+:H+ antiporter subunit G
VKTIIVEVLCGIGLFFALTAAVGMVRMPDVYTRIQCASKATTMGAVPLLIALTIAEGPVTSYGGRSLIFAILLLLVNPMASHALARAAYKTGVPMWRGAVADEPAAQYAAEHAGHRDDAEGADDQP